MQASCVSYVNLLTSVPVLQSIRRESDSDPILRQVGSA